MPLIVRQFDPSVLLRLGMISLIIASGLVYFYPPDGAPKLDLWDGVMGLFFGTAIAFNLLAVRLHSRLSRS